MNFRVVFYPQTSCRTITSKHSRHSLTISILMKIKLQEALTSNQVTKTDVKFPNVLIAILDPKKG